MFQYSLTVMAGLGLHQTSPHHMESANVHQHGELHDLEREKDMDNQQEGSLQTLHTGEVVVEEEVIQCMSKVMKKLYSEKLMI